MTEPVGYEIPSRTARHTAHIACSDKCAINYDGLFVLTYTHLWIITCETYIWSTFRTIWVTIHTHLSSDICEEVHRTCFYTFHCVINSQLEVSWEASMACKVYITRRTSFIRTICTIASRRVIHLGCVTWVNYALVCVVWRTYQNVATDTSCALSIAVTKIAVESTLWMNYDRGIHWIINQNTVRDRTIRCCIVDPCEV